MQLSKERFRAKILFTPTCWLWEGARDGNGYGLVKLLRSRKNILTHRAAYIMSVGEIPDGKMVLHSCDVKRCVNPAHLFLGTQADNQRDASTKGRSRGRLSK